MALELRENRERFVEKLGARVFDRELREIDERIDVTTAVRSTHAHGGPIGLNRFIDSIEIHERRSAVLMRGFELERRGIRREDFLQEYKSRFRELPHLRLDKVVSLDPQILGLAMRPCAA